MGSTTNLRTSLVMTVFLMAMACTAAGRTIYVDADAGGANNGPSWTDAYRYLQNGLAAAAQLGSLKDRRNSVLRSITTKDETAKKN